MQNKECIVLVGPQGSGKSTYAKTLTDTHVYINQDTQGKDGHKALFEEVLLTGNSIVIDRINHTKEQRVRYLEKAKTAGYTTKIIVFHENYDTCLARCKTRIDHPSIKDEATAKRALHGFFSKYERVQDDEADVVERRYPKTTTQCITIDIDGTLANIDHRLQTIKGEGKKNWKEFFGTMENDSLNVWCKILIDSLLNEYDVVICSGRPSNYKRQTQNWLLKHNVEHNYLFMRLEGDYRADNIVKENILDFEILTRYKPLFFVDDRQQVVNMYRQRGFTVLQCAYGDF